MSSDFELIESILHQRPGRRTLTDRLGTLGVSPGEGAARLAEVLLRLNALIAVSHQVADCLSLDTLLQRMMNIITETLDAERSTLFLFDTQTDELYSRIAQGDAMAEIRLPSSVGIAGNTFTSGAPVNIPDAYADDRFNPDVDKRTGYHTRNILCVPISNRDRHIIGVTQVLNKRKGPFTQEDQALLEAINAQAASALQNAQLFEQVQRAREEEAQLLALTTAIASELQLKPLLQKIMHQASLLMDADRSTLFLHDPTTEELWSQVAEGLDTKEIRFAAHLGIAGSVFISGRTINIPDAYADPRFNPAIDKETGYRTQTILCTPVETREGKRIGVIQILNKREGPFTPVDEERLAAFCAQASIALENARLFDEVVEMRNFNESILQSLTNGVICLDRDSAITKVNTAAARLLHVNGKALVGRQLDSVFAGANQWITDSIQGMQQTGETALAVDQEIVLAGQTTASVNFTGVPLFDLKQERSGSLLVFEDITTEKRMLGTLSRYMSKEVADRLMADGEEGLGGTVQEATVLFSDIRSFTTISEKIGARDTVSMLNDYFTVMVEILFRHAGILDKYIGDAIMAVFGAPYSDPRDADNAAQASIEMLRALAEFNRDRAERGLQVIDIGIGLNTDEILSGNIGSTKRMDYTVIGDGVNLASRLEGANKPYGTKILVSEFTVRRFQAEYLMREVDLLRVKGKEQPVAVFELLDYLDRDEYPDLREGLAHYDIGVAQYRRREWNAAIASFQRALAARTTDRVAALYIERCEYFRENPPDPTWDGVWVMTSK